MIEFDVLWQPIVAIQPAPRLGFQPVAAGRLIVDPPGHSDLNTWWQERIDHGEGHDLAGQIEWRCWPYLTEMQRVRRWHVPVHPLIPPASRTWLPLWHDEGVRINLVYEFPVDVAIDDWVWAEIELIRRMNRPKPEVPPVVAATHVGRHGLTSELAALLNDGPFSVLLLDETVTQGLRNRFDTETFATDPDALRLETLRQFILALRPDLPVVATGVSTKMELDSIDACGVRYGSGPLWMKPVLLGDVFRDPQPKVDPDWFPDKVYPNADDRMIPFGLTFRT